MKKTQYVCNVCGKTYAKWQGKCEGCGEWNTLVEEIVKEQKTGKKGAEAVVSPEAILSYNESLQLNGSFWRFSTGVEELDRALGGGMVGGSVVLIGGEPGIGKSTLLTQVVLNACRKSSKYSISRNDDNGGRVLYVCGEESPQQINLRLQRLRKKSEQKEDLALDYVIETDVDVLTKIVQERKPVMLIVDSIQTLTTGDLAGQAGSLGQVRESADRVTRVAKALGVPTFLVGHVTKEGGIAGPKVLEHMVDAIFELEGERSGELRFLRTLKNRFGATDEVGVFKMSEMGMEEVKNPSEYFLQGSQTGVPGSAVVCLLEGTRPLLTEVQALVVASQLAMPRRVGRGVDISRVQVLAAVLQKHCGLPLGLNDIFLSVVGGMKVSESGVDLGLAVALVSSLKGKPLPEGAVFIGEVGLMGEVRAVSAYERRVKEAKRLGYGKIYSYQTHKRVKELLQDLQL